MAGFCAVIQVVILNLSNKLDWFVSLEEPQSTDELQDQHVYNKSKVN